MRGSTSDSEAVGIIRVQSFHHPVSIHFQSRFNHFQPIFNPFSSIAWNDRCSSFWPTFQRQMSSLRPLCWWASPEKWQSLPSAIATGTWGAPILRTPPSYTCAHTHIYIYICIHIYRIIEIYTLMLLSSRQYTGSTILNVSPCLWAGLKHHQLYGNSSTEARVTGWKTPRRNCSKVDAHENPWNFSWKTWCESHGGLQMVVLVSWKSWREENKSTNGCSFWCNELLLAGKLFT